MLINYTCREWGRTHFKVTRYHPESHRYIIRCPLPFQVCNLSVPIAASLWWMCNHLKLIYLPVDNPLSIYSMLSTPWSGTHATWGLSWDHPLHPALQPRADHRRGPLGQRCMGTGQGQAQLAATGCSWEGHVLAVLAGEIEGTEIGGVGTEKKQNHTARHNLNTTSSSRR